MKKVAILRFGFPAPHALEAMAIQKFSKGEAMRTPFGVMGVLTIIDTEDTAATIATWMMEVHEKKKKEAEAVGKKVAKLPFIVFDLKSEDIGFNLHSVSPNIDSLFSAMGIEPMEKFSDPEDSVVKCTMTLDELLAKVSEGGVHSLTEEELTRLNELSGNV